ncbi:MAG: hypothetical protein R3B47_17810 [Bacteroidia bacterium]
MTKTKLLLIALIIGSLFGYLEWGTDMRAFLFETEVDVIGKLFTDPGSVLHPFILLPLAGQVMLLVALFQKAPGKALIFAGMACIAVLLVLIFFISLLGLNFKILVSTLPFLVSAVLMIIHLRSKKNG